MEKEKKPLSPIAAGFLICLILIGITMGMTYTGLYNQRWSQWVGYLVILGGIIWAMLNHSKQQMHAPRFGDLFAYGFKTTTVLTSIMVLFTILFAYMNPEMKDEFIQALREDSLAQPGTSASEVEKGMELLEKNYTLFRLIEIIFPDLIFGVIGSLLGAALAKKKPHNPFETTNAQS